MATAEEPATILQEDLDALQNAIDGAIQGVRDSKGRAQGV